MSINCVSLIESTTKKKRQVSQIFHVDNAFNLHNNHIIIENTFPFAHVNIQYSEYFIKNYFQFI